MSVSDVFLARDCVRAIRAAMIDSKGGTSGRSTSSSR
jgi:hypothetical protein